MGTYVLVTSSQFYLDIVDHACCLEQFSREDQGATINVLDVRGNLLGSDLVSWDRVAN